MINTEPIKKEEGTKNISLKKELLEWGKTIVVAFLIALTITTFVKPTLVVGQSMFPTFNNNNYLLVNRTAYYNSIPQHGDVIVFHTTLEGNKILIKRVIAISGDVLRIENGKVYVNNKLQNEPYIHGQQTEGFVDIKIPDGKLFVMGDNRGNSEDSRYPEVGLVDQKSVIGRVFFSVVPFSTIKPA